MQVLLSNMPGSVYKSCLAGSNEKNWVYFGSNQLFLKKCKTILSESGSEIDYGQQLYEMSKSVRGTYVHWLDNVGAQLIGQTEWTFSAPAVRNPHTSGLFLNVCYLEVFKQMIQHNKEPELVIVDSPALGSTIKKSFSDRVQYGPYYQIFKSLRLTQMFIRATLRYFRYLLDYSFRFIAAKCVFQGRKHSFLMGKENLVLIRSFITDQFTDTDNDLIEKHYFPGLYSYLKGKGCTPAFLAVVIKPANYFKLFKKVLKGKKNIIFAEEFLKSGDYLFAFLVPFRALKVKINPPVCGSFDISDLLKEDYTFNLTAASYLYSTLLSRLGRRMKEVNWDPKWIVNWAENQSIEKGIVSGLRKHFPKMKVIGGQPFIIPPNYLSSVFTRHDQMCCLLPDRVLTLGPLWRNAVGEFVDDLQTDFSPAFRYASAPLSRLSVIEGNNLIVLLGFDRENAVHIMSILTGIKECLDDFNRIFIKMHPASNFDADQLSDLVGEPFSETFEFVSKPLENYLDEVSVGLCGASGTAVELVMKGVPVVMIGETHTLTMNYLDYKQDDDVWEICFSQEQVIEALNRFRSLKKNTPHALVEKAQAFRRDFIAEPKEDYWKNYMVIDRMNS